MRVTLLVCTLLVIFVVASSRRCYKFKITRQIDTFEDGAITMNDTVTCLKGQEYCYSSQDSYGCAKVNPEKGAYETSCYSDEGTYMPHGCCSEDLCNKVEIQLTSDNSIWCRIGEVQLDENGNGGIPRAANLCEGSYCYRRYLEKDGKKNMTYGCGSRRLADGRFICNEKSELTYKNDKENSRISCCDTERCNINSSAAGFSLLGAVASVLVVFALS
ncbi:hypothetical protein L596_027410 [Steinernema carpocapsae]|uniref:Activin types I and II receptor domain-containing protein n=1 Tax=Steinernema carpocapsae TaxID=34508 RepID=A0A4U5M496_STECR|nr:hypothetical protein L596_027410 [Steinernema carpocapsae]